MIQTTKRIDKSVKTKLYIRDSTETIEANDDNTKDLKVTSNGNNFRFLFVKGLVFVKSACRQKTYTISI